QIVLPDRLVHTDQRENHVPAGPYRGPKRDSEPDLRLAARPEEEPVHGAAPVVPVGAIEPRVHREGADRARGNAANDRLEILDMASLYVHTAAPAAAAASASTGSTTRPPSASASAVPRPAQATSTRIGPAIRAPPKNSADRARSTLAPGGNTPPIVLHRPGSSGRANGPPDAELPRMTKTRMTSPVPAGPAAAWMPAVAAPLAK